MKALKAFKVRFPLNSASVLLMENEQSGVGMDEVGGM